MDEALTAAPGALPAGLPAGPPAGLPAGLPAGPAGGQVVRVALTYVVSSSMSERL